MQTDHDFLSLSMSMVRSSIRGIESSYSNYWDILAELLQNSVDAIKKTDRNGKIEISIDYPTKSIVIKDNGCGILPSELPNLLKPFCTNKLNDPATVGEKGVGLKYAYFQSLKFEIKTGTADGSIFARIENARLWKQQTTDESLPLDTETYDESFEGTEIKLEGIDNENLFTLTKEQLIYVLRTKTAVGNTDAIWGPSKHIDVFLKVTDSVGNQYNQQVPYKYFLPIDAFQPGNILDLDSYCTWLHESDRSDQQKRQKIKGKIITKKFIDSSRPGRPIKAWACFVPKREVWGMASRAERLISADEFDNNYSDSEWRRERADTMFTDGIFTAVKGMPTTIRIEAPSTGYSGYWPNMFIIFQDDKMGFDIGRKFIHGATTSIYKSIAAQIFKEITNIASKYISGNPEIVTSTFSREDLFNEINSLSDLRLPEGSGVKFTKNPYDQEASVCAIFYQLIGAGKINDVIPIISGYKNKYDLYAKWNGRTVVIEFKSRLRNILRDFDNAVKMFDEIDYVVCWGVTDEDTNELYAKGVEVEPLSSLDSELSSSTCYMSCVTHIMTITHSNPIYVIDLKQYLGIH